MLPLPLHFVMRIIIDEDFLSKQYLSGSDLYINELLLEIAGSHPAHSFIYVTHTPLATGAVTANVSYHHIKNNLAGWLGLQRRHTFLLPYALKKLQADLFVAVDHTNINSRQAPLCIFLPNGVNRHAATKHAGQYRQYRPAALQKAQVLFTTSAHDRQFIAAQHSIPPEKIHVLPPATDKVIKALSNEEKEAVRLQYAQGIEYFVFAGDIGEHHHLLELLKAFSQFKKWQQSNMKLVIAGNATAWTGELLQKTASFKYRNDVHILPGCSSQTLAALTAAAYAFVYPAPAGCFPFGIVHAMQAGVPVITYDTPVMKELAGNTVLYAVPGNEQGLTANMQLLYKDEALRKEMIERAGQHIGQTAKNNIAAFCWEIMMQSLQ